MGNKSSNHCEAQIRNYITANTLNEADSAKIVRGVAKVFKTYGRGREWDDELTQAIEQKLCKLYGHNRWKCIVGIVPVIDEKHYIKFVIDQQKSITVYKEEAHCFAGCAIM
uniref:Dynein light chain n=1 Tax=Acrobeloides nanus TaxID=290746 RepID=A0A914D7W7_9BILA